MPNLMSPTKKLLNNLAESWLGFHLTLLSPEGQLLFNLNASQPPILDGTTVVKQASNDSPTVLTYHNSPLFITPILQDHTLHSYMVVTGLSEQDYPKIEWIAEILTTHLTDQNILQDMTDELIGTWNQLELIYHVTQNLTLTTDLNQALTSILAQIQKVIDTEDGFILLKDSGKLHIFSLNNAEQSQFNEQLLDNVIQSENVMLYNTHTACQTVWFTAPNTINNLLTTPVVIIQENIQAALGLVNKKHGNFTTGDMKLLAALSHQVGLVIKNFMVRQDLILRERLAREREIAAQIQGSLLPPQPPQVGGMSIAVSSTPASDVGGDFYDFITADDQHITLIIGDVSGKGIPAATLTTVIRTILRSEIMRGAEPHTALEHANKILHEDLAQTESFVTALIVTIDTYDGKLSYANAGHMPGLLWQTVTRSTEQLKATTLPLGIDGFSVYSSDTMDLHPGDSLVLFTDGITEAQSPNKDLFGLHRLQYIVENRASEPPEQLQQFIQSEVRQFQRNTTPSIQDDATLLIIKMLPQLENMSSKDISTIFKTVKYSYMADANYSTVAEISQQIGITCREIPSIVNDNSHNAQDFIDKVELATSELCTNIIKHAYKGKAGKIDIHITLLSNGIQLDMYDQGAGFNPNSIPTPSPDRITIGGYGLHIIRQIMDVVSYEHHSEEGNHWHLLKMFLPRRLKQT